MRAQYQGLVEGLRTGYALADDVEGGAVGRGSDGRGQAGVDGDAAFEAKQLYGDLALVVIHGDDAVELAAAGAQEDGVGRVGAGGGDVLFLGGFDGGTDDIDLFAAEEAAFAGVGVETGHGEAGRRQAATADGVVDETDGGQNLSDGDVFIDGAQGDVGGNAGGIESVECVDFADVAADAKAVGEVAQLVLVAAAGGVHGLFVERGVGNAVDEAGAGEVGGKVEGLQDVAAGGGVHAAGRVFFLGEGWAGQEHGAGGRGRQVLWCAVARQVKLETGALGAPFQDPGFADDDDICAAVSGGRFVRILPFGEDAGDDFRTDPTGIAKKEGEARGALG